MRRLLFQIAIALLIFSLGAVAGAFWKTRRTDSQNLVAIAREVAEEEWPLTKEVVARSLQSHSFTTDKRGGIVMRKSFGAG